MILKLFVHQINITLRHWKYLISNKVKFHILLSQWNLCDIQAISLMKSINYELKSNLEWHQTDITVTRQLLAIIKITSFLQIKVNAYSIPINVN